MSLTIPTAVDRARHYQQVSALYTNNGWDRLKRHWKYIQLPDKETENSYSVALMCIGVSAFAGAKVGKVVGKEAERFITNNSDGGEFGGVVGQGLGFVVGGIGGGYAYITLTEHNPHFRKWREGGFTNAVKQAITLNYSEEVILKNFTCPVSLCVMDVPAHTPSGVFYDMLYIMNCTREYNGDIKDPQRNASFPESSVLPDFERAIVIHKRVRHLLRMDIQALNDNPELKKVLEGQLKEVEESVANRYENARERIEERRKAKVITHSQYKQEMDSFEKIFGESYETDLDWSLNWMQILDERWMYFNPDTRLLEFE